MNPNSSCIDRINLLPDWYVREELRRRSLRRQILLAVIMAVGMIVLRSTQSHELSEKSLYHAELRQQITDAQEKVTEMVKLQQEREQLNHQYRIYRELAQPVTFSQITGTIASHLPETICLRELSASVKEERIEIKPPADEKRKRNSRVVALKTKPVIQTRPIVAIQIEGSAPSNVDVANLVGKLASNRLFQNVKMIHSEQGKIGNAITRDFRIMMEVRLDRTYVPMAREEVAHVD